MRIYVNFYLLPCSADSLSVMLTEDLQSSGRKAWLPRAAGQHKPFKSWLLFNLVRHKMPCASAFAFTFSNYLFFQHKELKYHCVLFQTCFLSCSKSIKLGNRQGSCLGASTISNTVMLTHFYEGCVCSQWKTTLKTVRQMTNTQIKSVLVGGHPVLLLFSCHFWIPNSNGHFSKGSNVVWFEEVGHNLFVVYHLKWIDF